MKYYIFITYSATSLEDTLTSDNILFGVRVR